MSDTITVTVSYVPALKKGEKYTSCVLLAFNEEIGDTGLCNSEWAWSPNMKPRKVGDMIEMPGDISYEFYDREAVDEETGEVTKFTWVRWKK